MLKKFLSHRMTGILIFLVVFGGLLFVVLREGNAQEKTKKGWLGVSVQELTPSLRETMKTGNRSGLLITEVMENSPADEANLREEDVLLAFDGKTVEKVDDFTELVRNTPPDKKVKVKILRDGEDRELEVIIGARKTESRSHSFNWNDGHNMMAWNNRPHLGVKVQDLNKDLAPYFKVEEKGGVLVLEVGRDTPAAKAGLKAGDVITRVADEKITDADDLIAALRDYDEGDKVSIEYVRQGKTTKAEAAIENDESHGFQFFTPEHKKMRIPLRDKIRIESFGGDDDEMIFLPDIHRHLESLEKGLIERDIQDRLRKKLENLPKKLDIDNLRTI